MHCPQIRPDRGRTLLGVAPLCALVAVMPAGGQSLCDDFHVPAAHLGNFESCVYDGAGTTIVNLSAPAILNWERGFRIGANQHLRFNFNTANGGGAVLNRDTTGGFSPISGRLTSNGRVMLLNPGGIISIQNGAEIDADGGFLASTLAVSDEEALLRGDDVEFRGGGGAGSAIENRGTVRSAGGDVVLISSSVNNWASGRLLAPAGNLRVGAGSRVRLFGGPGSTIDVLEGDGRHTIINSGEIAARNAIELSAFTTESVAAGDFDPVVDNAGTIRATSADGRVFLRAPGSGGGQIRNSAGALIVTPLFAVENADFIVGPGARVVIDDGSNPAPPSGARQFPRLSAGSLTDTPTDDFRLSRLSFSHLNGLESKAKRAAKPAASGSTTVALRGAANADARTKKPAPQPKKVILRRGSFFGKKTS